MEPHVNYTCKVFVKQLLIPMVYKTFMLDQTSRKFQELLLVYVLINILSMKIQLKPTNVKNISLSELVSKMVFTITYLLHMKERLVVALMALVCLVETLVETQLL
jgi:hypothetical protein